MRWHRLPKYWPQIGRYCELRCSDGVSRYGVARVSDWIIDHAPEFAGEEWADSWDVVEWRYVKDAPHVDANRTLGEAFA